MTSLKELQILAVHGMLGAEDFLHFREQLYQNLVLAKYKNLIEGMNGDDKVGLSKQECLLVETCLEIFKSFDIADEYAIEKTFYLLKSLVLHFQMRGLEESAEKTGRIGLNQDSEYQVFLKEDLIGKINIQYTDFNNLQIFNKSFIPQKRSLEKYCRQELPDCYELISGLCEG